MRVFRREVPEPQIPLGKVDPGKIIRFAGNPLEDAIHSDDHQPFYLVTDYPVGQKSEKVFLAALDGLSGECKDKDRLVIEYEITDASFVTNSTNRRKDSLGKVAPGSIITFSDAFIEHKDLKAVYLVAKDPSGGKEAKDVFIFSLDGKGHCRRDADRIVSVHDARFTIA